MSVNIRQQIIDEFVKRFREKYLQKRFEKNYAYNQLNYRRRSRMHKGDSIAVKSGELKKQFQATFRSTPSGMTANVPNYAKAKSWKVPFFIYAKNHQVAMLLEKFANYSVNELLKVLRQLLPGWPIQKIRRMIYQFKKWQKQPRWFNAEKSIFDEISTISDSEVNSICKSLSDNNLTLKT